MAISIDYETFWNEIPIGRENAYTYDKLCEMWECSERTARHILHELSSYDNGDDFILIRSGSSKGFYRTDNPAEIERYRQECLNKGRSIFVSIKKCNRVLDIDKSQLEFELFA